MTGRMLYAWQEHGKWCLSWFKQVYGKPKNIYATQQEVIAEAAKRQAKIEWLP